MICSPSHIKKKNIFFGMTKIFDESGNYEFPFLMILKITFTQNQLENISESKLTNILFWIKKQNLIQSRYNAMPCENHRLQS